MLAAAIILCTLLLLALLRAGIVFQYCDAGPVLWLKIGFLKIHLPDAASRTKRRRRRRINRLSELKPGSPGEFIDILKALKKMLVRIKRRLLIKKLIIHYTWAGDDPSAVAMMYGMSNAVLGVIVPVFERHFRVKKRDIQTFADFTAREPGIYVKFEVSIAIWEAIYILAAILPAFATSGGYSRTASGGPKIRPYKKTQEI